MKKYILNYWKTANYGANLTAYALYCLVENSCLVDNFSKKILNKMIDFDFQTRFALNNFLSTEKYTNIINNKLDSSGIFIVGSDQVFRPNTAEDILDTFLLGEINEKHKKIAFSASFGVDKEKFLKETSSDKIKHMKNSLKFFDFISCREKSGVEICRDLFDVKAEWIIDPVFILDKSKYDELIQNSTNDFSGKIVSYMFKKQNNILNKLLERKFKKDVIELCKSNLSVEDWLNAIKNCEFLVTNSYHAMCFAIIFNKPFIALSKDMGASARFESLFEMLNIKDQSINDIKEIYERNCIFEVDYDNVNKRIQEERQRGLDFLKMALDTPVRVTPEKIKARMNFLEHKICELEQQATLKYQIQKELWNLWLIIFHKYLPESVKDMIRFVRDKLCK